MEKLLVGADYFKNFINLSGFKKSNSKILFTKTGTDIENNKYCSDLHILDTDLNEIQSLTGGIDIDIYQWSGDGRVIFTAVIDDEDKKLQEKMIPITAFYELNTETKGVNLLFKVNKNISDFVRISDTEYYVLCSDTLMDDHYFEQAKGDWEEFSKIKIAEKDFFVAEEVPYWTNASGHCNGDRGRVFSYIDGELEQISPNNLYVTAISGFKDQYIAYTGVESGGVQNTSGKLYKYSIEKKEIVPIDETEEYIYTYLDAISESEILVCRNDRRFHGEYQNEYIDLINIKTHSYVRKNEKGDYHIYDNVVCDVSYLSNWLNKIIKVDGGIYFIATEMESSKVFYWGDSSDLPIQITKEQGKIIDYEIVGENLYIIAMRGLGGTEIYEVSKEDGKEKQLTTYNTELENDYQYSEVAALPFINSNGVEIQGWFMKPVNFKEGEKYPTILFIHGGPQCAFGEIFNHDMQLMTANGYGVLFCNPTGSEGRGGNFSDIRMKYGTIDYDDLIGFTEHAVSTQDWIDAKNLGVTGGSYGGIMTNWIIGHTDMFKVAVSDRGVCNNISDFGLSDIGISFGLDTFETTPWDDIDLLWEASPLKYAPDMKAPLLLIHGMEDYRCTYDSALQLHTALTYFGTPSKVFVFKDENHELCRSGQPKNRTRRLEEILEWFDKYTK